MGTEGRWGRRLLSLGALVAAVAVAMVALSPSRPRPTDAPTPTTTRLSAPEEYVRRALEVMEEHAFLVNEATWPDVVRNAMAAARQARTIPETYDALIPALGAAAGPQGLFLAPDRANLFPQDNSPVEVVTGGGIGRITVPPVGLLSSGATEARASAIATAVDDAAARVSCGWLVDLRPTSSSEDWAVFAGLEPFTRQGWAFRLQDRLHRVYQVSIAMGSVFLDGRPMASSGHTTAKNSKPVAVLQSASTTGAGEGLVIALRRSDKVRTFGEATRARPITEQFQLSDGAVLVLPTVQVLGASGDTDVHGVPPSVLTEDPERDAMAWLRSQCKQT